jgi:hypothetical protein
MRFHEKVQEPGHPLHKAWAELSRPGRAGFVDRLRVKRLDIDKLLTGVRQHYPELESHLDPQRVASWEGDTNASGVSDTGPRVVRGIFIVLLVIALPRLISAFTDPRYNNPAPPVAEIAVALQTAEIATAILDIFGPGTSMAWMRATDPVFAEQFTLAVRSAGKDPAPVKAFVRRKALEAGEAAAFDDLVARATLRRLWLVAAQRQSARTCQNVLAGDFASLPLELTEQERELERAVLVRLLNAQALRHEAKGGPTQYTLPGWVVSDVITRSGLGKDAVLAALKDMTSADRCKVEVALAEVVIANPARVPEELLRGL